MSSTPTLRYQPSSTSAATIGAQHSFLLSLTEVLGIGKGVGSVTGCWTERKLRAGRIVWIPERVAGKGRGVFGHGV